MKQHAESRLTFQKLVCAIIPPILIILTLWSSFFRGLPTHIAKGIPFTAHHTHVTQENRLVQGDHLQLLYHFWLTREKITGRTPIFSNIYEFNIGDDAERVEFDPGYIPFSLIYSLVAELGFSHALGWNLAQLSALLCTFIFLYRLSLRYAPSKFLARCVATLAMCVPYQWINLSVGSPTGFGMTFIPMLALGIDIAVREGKTRGGFLAGLAILFCYTSDLHCMAFACLLTPAWCIVAWCARKGSLIPTKQSTLACINGLWPTVISGACIVAVAKMLTSYYAKTDASDGRSINEILPNSPHIMALWGHVSKGADLHFRMGYFLCLATLLSLLTILIYFILKRKHRADNMQACTNLTTSAPGLTASLIIFGVFGVILLGLGYNAPGDGLPIEVMRKIAPPYKMIRQPVKVFCVLPTLLAPLFALSLSLIATKRNTTQSAKPCRFHLRYSLLIVVLAICTIVETASIFHLGITQLPSRNSAYEAMVNDAKAKGITPHVLALPIWPGDSAWSSLYEYNTMLYGARMVNGYAAVCSEEYLKIIYKGLESVTQGRLSDDQLELLRSRGITYLALYANAFPEQVSPFPVDLTFKRLLDNPNLKLIAVDDVIMFAILDKPCTPHVQPIAFPELPFVSPTRRWSSLSNPTSAKIDSICAKACLRSPAVISPNVSWMIRIKGQGLPEIVQSAYVCSTEMDCQTILNQPTPSENVSILSSDNATDTHWLSVPIAKLNDDWSQFGISVDSTNTLHVLDIFLAHGHVPLNEDEIVIPANSFFHAGITAIENDTVNGVRLRPNQDPTGEIFYGFNLPIKPGTWTVSVNGDTDSKLPHTLRVLENGIEIASGGINFESNQVTFTASAMAPITFRLNYTGKDPIHIKSLTLQRQMN